jgi:hypothetical protein
MKCYLCRKNATIKQQKNRYICDNCFCRLIIKRIRKFCRLNKVFKKNDKILVIGELNKYLAKNVVEKRPVKLFFRARDNKDFVKKNKINKILIQWTLDDEANNFLLGLFKGAKIKKFDEKYIKFLVSITNEEAGKFAKIKKLKFKANKIDAFIKKLVDDLHKEHPSARYTLLKNLQELAKLRKMSSVK